MKRILTLFVIAAGFLLATSVPVWAQAACALKQSTASQEISVGPFLDSTDGDTEKTGLTIVASDIRLKKGSADWASKNSGGATAEEHGNYRITLDATDTATIGMLEINIHVSGALAAWRTCFVYTAAVYNALTGSGTFDSNLTKVNGTSQTGGDLVALILSSRPIPAGTTFEWAMQFFTSAGVLVTSGSPACTVSVDAPGSFVASHNSPSAVTANGLSEITLDGATDVNGNYYTILKCTLTGAVDYYNLFKVQR